MSHYSDHHKELAKKYELLADLELNLSKEKNNFKNIMGNNYDSYSMTHNDS